MKKLVIIGAGGFGREVADTVRRINAVSSTYEIIGFVDDDNSVLGKTINDIKIVGNKEWLKTFALGQEVYAVMAIASADVKRKISDYLADTVVWENIIDPSALISQYAKLGRGNVFQPYVVIGPNTKIGDHCMFNLRTNMGHDAQAEDFVSVMSMCDITGGVILREGAYLATSVSIVPQLEIGRNAFVCAGAVVLKNVEEDARVIGYPAKRIK
ncbi:NeuD/PglB/VioB family sugar acetyltransferase [Aminipila terrae]|uniref:PglD N-terminal domain-containing protein n=1 Tax=Aminipila terrae TaxID=2697030 RepID=A0A6P1ME21_9FIRM|nr:NeuD/PglB/VioB family sugar acetyltransferase [Aminipila terrae]QHI72081.1 hypothetical protein Ami3637_06420 [Aminipila terrae]